MLSERQVRRALKRPAPDPPWGGEPLLGGIYGEEEIEAAVAAMRSSMDPQVGFGFSAPPIPDFEAAFARYCGTAHAVALNSAGPGLDMAMRWLRLQPGDEVIVPAVNFPASPLAVYGAGGQVVWGDIDGRTFQLDPADVEARITPRTRAIFPVHMNGLAAPLDELIELGRRHPHPEHGPIPVIGDAARACGGGYRGTKLGKKGLLTVFSFHTMKNMTTLGEGGMLTTDDDGVAEYCRSVRMYGGGVEEWGTSNVMTKVQAAVGLVQLGRLDSFVAARRRLAQARSEMLEGLEEIVLPLEPQGCEHSYYLYTCLVCPAWAGDQRDRLVEMMTRERGVGCTVANRPVYQTRRLLREHTAGQSLPVSDDMGERLFCISLHPSMTEADNEYAAASLIDCVRRLSCQ